MVSRVMMAEYRARYAAVAAARMVRGTERARVCANCRRKCVASVLHLPPYLEWQSGSNGSGGVYGTQGTPALWPFLQPATPLLQIPPSPSWLAGAWRNQRGVDGPLPAVVGCQAVGNDFNSSVSLRD